LRRKVIVIGLDGLEPGIVEAMLERGELPNLAKIRASGSYSRLKTTYPAQTPVAWSSFATGTNPGGHGIFDFICRDPKTYLPDVALTRFERPKNMLAQPRAVNRRSGVPVWQILSAAGIPNTTCAVHAPFLPKRCKAACCPAAGVPDLRGSQSKGTFYTQDRRWLRKRTSSSFFWTTRLGITTRVIRPRNTQVSPRPTLPAKFASGGQGGPQAFDSNWRYTRQIDVPEKGWSDWVRFKFKFSMLRSVTGIARFMSPVGAASRILCVGGQLRSSHAHVSSFRSGRLRPGIGRQDRPVFHVGHGGRS
jgi:hypothetical protein